MNLFNNKLLSLDFQHTIMRSLMIFKLFDWKAQDIS